LRAVVLGIDGAAWDFLLHPGLSGYNDCFKTIRRDRPSGTLLSTTPPVTGPAWVSFATGCNPGEHGCYDFLMPKEGLTRTSPITARDISRPTFYEMLDAVGKRSILINLPCSYPPKVSGIVITSLMTQGDRFIFPEGTEKDLSYLSDYRAFPDLGMLARGETGSYLADVLEVERRRFRCAQLLFEEEWDFFFVLFSAIDWALHAAGGSIASAASNPRIREICRDVGEYVQWFECNCPTDSYLILMSDHGFADYSKPFYVNALLRENGFLKLAQTEEPIARPHRIFEEYRSQAVELKPPSWAVSILRRSPRLMEMVSRALGRSPVQLRSRVHLAIDPESAAACLSPGMSRYGTIHLAGEGKRTKAGNVTKSLLEAEDPYTNERIVRRVWQRDEVYHGGAIERAPALVIESNRGYWVNNDLTYPRITIRESRTACNHDPSGIFAVLRPEEARVARSEARIEDLAPTILSIYGMPIPEWIDGSSLLEGLKPDRGSGER
jgi:predicted AlkP superfamily phosphohydrolase/phosphomutase